MRSPAQTSQHLRLNINQRVLRDIPLTHTTLVTTCPSALQSTSSTQTLISSNISCPPIKFLNSHKPWDKNRDQNLDQQSQKSSYKDKGRGKNFQRDPDAKPYVDTEDIDNQGPHRSIPELLFSSQNQAGAVGETRKVLEGVARS